MATAFVQLTGLSPYLAVHQLQQALIRARLAGQVPDTVLLLEHTPTITVGRGRHAEHSVIDAGDTPVIPVERGGDATWHGPGQLVAYPIVQLTGVKRDLRRHLGCLEQAVIDWLTSLGLLATRDPRNTGVWLRPKQGLPLKVGSVGTACRRWVTWHGLSVNLTVDLSAQSGLRPCGFDPSVLTRVADWTASCPTPRRAASLFAPFLAATLGLSYSGQVVEVSDPAQVLGTLRG